MFKQFLIPLFFFAALCCGLAQNTLDSLRDLVDEASEPRLKVDALNNLADALYDYNLEESFRISGQALNESRITNYALGESRALLYQSRYYQMIGQPKTALNLIRGSIQKANQLNEVNLKAQALVQGGKIFRDIGLLDSAAQYYDLAESTQKINSDRAGLWWIYSAKSKYYLLIGNQAEALSYARLGYEMAKQEESIELIAYSWLDIGDCHRDKYDFVQARECYEKALEINGKADWLITDYHESMGYLYFLEGDFEKAFDALSQVMKTYEIYDGKYSIVTTMIKMGEILEEKGLYDVSLEYLYKALRISEQAGYLASSADAYYELAWVNYRLKQWETALLDIRKAQVFYDSVKNELNIGGCLNVRGLIHMKKGNYDSSWAYHQQGLALRKKAGNSTAVSSSLFNIGDLLSLFNKDHEALAYYKQGLAMDETNGDRYGIGLYKNRIARIFIRAGDYKQAKEYLEASMSLAQQTSALDLLRECYMDYSIILEKEGNTALALHHRKLYEALNDSLYSRSTAQSMASYRTLYELDQKGQQIEILNKDKLIQQDQIRQRNLVLYWVASIASALALLAFIFLLL